MVGCRYSAFVGHHEIGIGIAAEVLTHIIASAPYIEPEGSEALAADYGATTPFVAAPRIGAKRRCSGSGIRRSSRRTRS